MGGTRGVIAVTGATGFLGGHLVRALDGAGYRVRSVSRRAASATARLPIAEAAVADLADESALRAAFAGADVVVSNAAVYTIREQPWDVFLSTNVGGTERVLRAAAAAGVRRVVHVSSTAVYRDRWGHTLHEGSAQLTEADRGKARAYAISKAVSEQLAWRLATELAVALTCLRPCAIYGSDDRQFLPYMARWRRSPVLPLPRLELPLVHASDVADACVAALASPTSVGRSYNLASAPVSLATLMRTWNHVAGRGPWVLEVPLRRWLAYDTSAAARDLGFRARSLSDGLSEALATGFADRPA